MTDYTKLVKALRYCVSGVCKNCSYFDKCKENGTAMAQLHNDAAAAIEELENMLADECKECDHLVDENARLTTENKELQAELAGSKDAIRILKHNLEMKKPKRGEIAQMPIVEESEVMKGTGIGTIVNPADTSMLITVKAQKIACGDADDVFCEVMDALNQVISAGQERLNGLYGAKMEVQDG